MHSLFVGDLVKQSNVGTRNFGFFSFKEGGRARLGADLHKRGGVFLSHELLAGLDVLGEGREALVEEGLLGRVEVADRVDLTDGTLAGERDGRREEVAALVGVERALDVGAELDVLLAVHGAEERVSPLETGVGHREGRRTGTVLGLDDLVATELDAVHELLEGLATLLDDLLAGGELRQKGDDGRARVATDDGDVRVLGLGAGDSRQERRGTDNVEGRDTEEALRVVDAGLLEDLGDDRDGRVDRVGDDSEASLGRDLGGGLGEVANDRGVGLRGGGGRNPFSDPWARLHPQMEHGTYVEEVVTGHAGLAGHAGRDEDDLGTLEGLLETAVLRAVTDSLRAQPHKSQ